jgi:diguanylate cyclase (GGDEF)-like protein
LISKRLDLKWILLTSNIDDTKDVNSKIKFILTPIIVVMLIFAGSLFVVDQQIKKEVEREQSGRLHDFALLTHNAVSQYLTTPLKNADVELHNLAKTLSTHHTYRISLIDLSGNLVGDSALEYQQLSSAKNLLSRPEVIVALAQGKGSHHRISSTLGTFMHYYAIYDESVPYIVRVSSVELDTLPLVEKLKQSFVLITIISATFIILYGLVISKVITKVKLIERKRQENKLIVRTREITLLNTLSTLLNNASDLDAASKVLFNLIPQILPNYAGHIYLEDESHVITELVNWGKIKIPPLSNKQYMSLNHSPVLKRGSLITRAMISGSDTIGYVSLQYEGKEAELDLEGLQFQLIEQVAAALTNLQTRNKLLHQAIRDPLTNLYNRRFLLETFEQSMNRAERHNTYLSVLMIDLDHFKQFNDKYGHEVGDQILVNVSKLFTDNVRMEDTICRYGGEEFCIVCPDTNLPDAFSLAEKLREKATNSTITSSVSIIERATFSVGIAVFPIHGMSIHSLLEKADKALYKAKQKGRNTVIVSDIENHVSSDGNN